ncbi:hypothetical protein, partial [Phenylobacterium sp.]|uniref:hypothetical protein n=1 Tax=Phenylobacterium sp. TaxID=1871053 RepID=UPI00286C2D1B
TKAQMAGFTETKLRGRILIAGLRLRQRPIAVVDLDARTAPFPTPIAGVIGADLLSPYVVDVRFSPCRVAIRRPGQARRFPAVEVLAMSAARGPATVRAAVADGPHAQAGVMVLSTGSDAPVRLYQRVAGAWGTKELLLPYDEHRANLRALSLGGALFENVPAGLLADGPSDRLGMIGAPILSRWRVRFDFPGRRVLLATP